MDPLAHGGTLPGNRAGLEVSELREYWQQARLHAANPPFMTVAKESVRDTLAGYHWICFAAK